MTASSKFVRRHPWNGDATRPRSSLWTVMIPTAATKPFSVAAILLSLLLIQNVLLSGTHHQDVATSSVSLRHLSSGGTTSKNNHDANDQQHDHHHQALARTKPASIPHNLHFIYVSVGLPEEQDPIPDKVWPRINAWKELHPHYGVRVWTNSAVRREFKEHLPLLEKLHNPAWISDILRYLIVEKLGGIYLDTDMIPIRSLEPLRNFAGDAFTICWHPRIKNVPVSEEAVPLDWLLVPEEGRKGACERLQNCVIGAASGHPALKTAAREAIANTHMYLAHSKERISSVIGHVTGQDLWTKIGKEHNLTVFKSSVFEPCSHKNTCAMEGFKSNKNVYAVHWGDYSWAGKLRALSSTEESNLQDIDLKEEDEAPMKWAKPKRSNIPKKIHLIYISVGLAEDQGPIPDEVLQNVKDWQALHPGWGVRFWTNGSVRREFKQHLPLLEKLNAPAWVSDVLRYLILEKQGGFYIDTDTLPLRNLDPLRNSFEDAFATCFSPHLNNIPTNQEVLPIEDLLERKCHRFQNSLIGIAPGHPAMKAAAAQALGNSNDHVQKHNKEPISKNIGFVTGQDLWTRIGKEHNLPVLKSSVFFPCGWREAYCTVDKFKNNPNVYGMHQNDYSWKGK